MRTVAGAEPLQPESDEFPSVLVKLMPYEKNPIFVARGPGHWDEKIRERGWVMREGNQWRMWYTGYQPSGQMKLGYATSPDGITWQRYGDRPIYDERWVEDMMVVAHDGTYYMFAEGYQDRAQLLTSSDGIQWVYKWPLEIRRTNGEPISPGPYGTPTAWYADGHWWLLYERGDDAVWLAKSTDLRTWQHLQDEPVLQPGPGKYDSKKIAVNQLLSFHGRYYVYYHGLGDTNGNWTTNIATSTDLRNWEKYEGNPLFPVETNKSSGFIVLDGNKARVYTMHSQVHLHFPRE
jgi:beta-1,2-mannobiose phosphorylase / 1,2-beta-oligomannan phosphorylase